MRRFQYVRPESLEQALGVLDEHGHAARVIAGGQDLLFRIKKRIVQPDYVVGIKGLPELAGVRLVEANGNGSQELSVGSSETLTSLARSPLLRQQYTAIAEAAKSVASPQIRNSGTLGGNLCQDVWCWYLQSGFDCWKAGGHKCDLVRGDARYYGSVFLGFRCQANHPSDVAPALEAFDAQVEIAGPGGIRKVPLGALLGGHKVIDGVLQAHSLQPNEILKSIRLPKVPQGTRSTYSKFALRGSWDFAIAAAAVRLTIEDSVCTDARIVLGGVATKPYRCSAGEAVIVGKRIDEALAAEAGAVSVEGARPLKNNAYKVDIARTLVKRAIVKLAA